VRVIAGHFRGTKLHSPPGEDIRPTADRLRESIFNIIGPRIRGKHVLDLFAGTGAMGIEALSRGAHHAVFIDKNPQALNLIQRNVAKVRAAENATVIAWDIRRDLNCLKNLAVPEIIFIDPPYRQGLIQSALANLKEIQIPFHLVVVEHDPREPLENRPAGLDIVDQRRYGKTLVSFLNGVV
jgi:16S rRNA (guanine966-N2)-methyltransferase